MTKIARLFAEARRRRVFRMSALYIVAAWIILQVADVVFPIWSIPEAAKQYVLIGAFLGFPIALVFAWSYDVTPHGIVRTAPARSGEQIDVSLRRSDYLVLAAFAFVAVAIMYSLVGRILQTPGEQSNIAVMPFTARSIAVLPFDNRSPDVENAYFADGVHDDLLTLLSQLRDLKVVSRTSVEKFRETAKATPEIGRELGVTYVIEGAVQRLASQVRINVKLIFAATDEQIWAETYDRDLSAVNLFAIQSEIAELVVNSLEINLSSGEKDKLNALPTENLDALQSYFRGKQRMAKRTIPALAESVVHFQQAIDLDPGFALAYVGLADSKYLHMLYADLPDVQILSDVEAAINKALELDGMLGEAYASLGSLGNYRGDFEAAEAAFIRATELNPNYATAHQWYGAVLGRMGRYEESLVQRRKAQELDPLSAVINLVVGNTLSSLGRFDEALQQYLTVIEIDPAFPGPYERISDIYHYAYGQLDEAVIWQRKGVALDPEDAFGAVHLGWLYLDLGDTAEAECWFERSVREETPEHPPSAVAMEALNLYHGNEASALTNALQALVNDPTDPFTLAHLRNLDIQAGHYLDARARYQIGYPELLDDRESNIGVSNFDAAIDLALVLTKTGEQERADLLLERSTIFIQSIPRMGINGYAIADAMIFAIQGKKTLALSALRQAIDEGWRVKWWFYLRYDPGFDAVREDPAFQFMIEEIRADMEVQLERTRTTVGKCRM